MLRLNYPNLNLTTMFKASFSSSSFKSPQIAINLGSANSYLSIMEENHHPKVIQKFQSLVHLKAKSYPINKILGFTRLLGRKFDDPIIQKEIRRWVSVSVPYKIIRAPNGGAWVETSYGHQCSPTYMLKSFLAKMKETAETYLGYSVSHAIITLPTRLYKKGLEVPDSLLSNDEFEAIVDAAGRGGIMNSYFINECTAAAYVYGLVYGEGLFAIVDLGARTLDVSLMQVSCGGSSFQLVGKPMCDMYLGGEDFDFALVDYLVSQFKTTNLGVIDVTKDLTHLHLVAEKAKIHLSSALETEINMPYTATCGTVKHLGIRLTRSSFENLVKFLVERIRAQCQSCLDEAGIAAKNVDKVILVGGMARVPMVQKIVTEVFGKRPCRRLNPEEAVALGAIGFAYQARYSQDDKMETPLV